MINLIYLDMDGVLTNFNKKYFELFGVNPDSISRPDFDSRWRHFITGGHFMDLEVLEGATDLLDFVRGTGLPYEILSSTGGPDYYDLIRDHKTAWLEKHGIRCPKNIVPGKKYKRDFAAPDRLLIDDHEGIIDKFIAAGGHGIHHRNANSTICRMKTIYQLTTTENKCVLS
jgi:hypothetical protein